MADPVNHTPGPWKTAAVAGEWVIKTHDRQGLQGYIAGTFMGTPHCRANAHLMAAAPDLLDALILALPYVESEEENPAYDAGVVVKVVKQMRSAIARAEGREG